MGAEVSLSLVGRRERGLTGAEVSLSLVRPLAVERAHFGPFKEERKLGGIESSMKQRTLMSKRRVQGRDAYVHKEQVNDAVIETRDGCHCEPLVCDDILFCQTSGSYGARDY